MRIALVSQEYPPETAKGGIGSQTFAKAHGLAALGHDVHVISRTLEAEVTEFDDAGVTVTRVPGAERRLKLYTEVADWLTYSAEVAAAVATLAAKSPLDIIDFPEWGCEGYVYLLNRTEWNYIPVAIQLHGPLAMLGKTIGWPSPASDFYRIGKVMEGTSLGLADGVFSSSRCSRDWCAAEYVMNADAIPVIHAGVDVENFSPREKRGGHSPTIIFAGKVARNKGAEVLVKAVAELAKEFPALRLRLLGRCEASLMATLQDIAARAGMASALEMPGFVSRSELADELSNADVFAAPSEYEGGPGFVYLEAMACGLPVVACEGSGAEEVVQDGITGFLVPPNDVTSTANAIRILLLDSERRARMGAAARAFVEAEADSRTCVKQIEGFYERIIAQVSEKRSGL